MISFEQARKIMVDRLENSRFSDEDSLIILDEFTIEKPYGWVFYYTSKLYYETKNSQYAIAGNSPIIVDKQTGEQSSYMSAYSDEEMLQKHEEEKRIWRLNLTESHLLDKPQLIRLKNKLNLNLNTLKDIKNNQNYLLDSGSEYRLKLLQIELLNIGIETELVFSWQN